MSTTSLLINDIRNKLLIAIGIIFIFLGTVGNILNIILFKRRSMWTLSPSIPLLLIASICNLITIYPYLLLRTFLGFNLPLVYTSSILCKMHVYCYYISIVTSTWLMVACCADRFFSSSRHVKIRAYSNMKTTRRITMIAFLVIPCVYIPTLYCYEINQFTKPVPCYQQNSECGLADIVNYFVFQSVGPPIFMLIFTIGTIMHIRQGHQVGPDIPLSAVTNPSTTIHKNTRINRKTNRANTRLLYAQVIVYLLCSIPLFTMKLYALIPLSIVKSDVRISVEALLLNVALWFSLVDKIFSFYIYTLSSRHFRQELMKLFRKNIQQRQN
ncbi:unnamed protein product [Adineta ricciae]|uniref:G-protein coupled receptors family 1 profile domain-containing protein n=1 Tax=Adineta ricciae TaxID=249248 RepID=A0A815BUU8_ADIRI|nr:unnamed protein product [Adineta ricciae]CAF1369489.1 unnamed protein product [Adineta ricciae]